MDSLNFSSQLIAGSNSFSYCQSSNVSVSSTTGQAFYREVEVADYVLCPMCSAETNENSHQMPMVPFENPFNNSKFEKRSVTIIFNRSEENQLLDLSVREEPKKNDQAPTYIPSNERFSIQSILGIGQLASQSSSVVDNNLHYPIETSNQDPIDTFSKPAVPVVIITPQLNSEQLQQNTSPAGNEFDFNSSASASGESLTISPDKASRKASRKAYTQTEKGKASRRAYCESEKGKASQKASRRVYCESEKGKASRRAYGESEKGKASQKACRESKKGKDYHKAYSHAYHKVLNNTGDKEQAKIAGRQAAALIRESNKAQNLIMSLNKPKCTNSTHQ